MKFAQLAQAFAAIEAESSRTKMMHILGDLFVACNVQDIKPAVYLAMGTINPPYLPTQLGLASKSVIKVIASLLDAPQTHVEAWAKEYGDLGLVLLRHYKQGVDTGVTVQQVHQILLAIVNITGAGAHEAKQAALQKLLENVDAIQACYIVRIVIGKLRLGFSDMTIIDALSYMLAGDKSVRKDLEEAYNLCADLGYIAEVAKKGGAHALEHVSVHVGIPIRLAAAERLPTAEDIMEKLGPSIAEPKVDGFRLQVHKYTASNGNVTVRFFSRNLIDMSDSFPDLVHAIEKLPAKDLIFEGEAIGYNRDTNEFVPFQETVKRKRKHGIEGIIEELPLKLFAFDLLYIDGKLLIDQPFIQRRLQLKELLAHHTASSTIVAIEEAYITTAEQLEEYFYICLEHGLEGVMVKRADSSYQAGKRNFNWIKLKRQEQGHLEDTIDCVILGYYAGKGKRTSFGIGAFLVGVYNKANDTIQTIAKIGTGLTDDQWRELHKILDQSKIDHKPALVQCDAALVPDVWVTPQIVCMVRADDITRSPLHTAGKTSHELGYALRFPRFMGYRPDKSVNEITTVDEIKHLAQDQKVLRS